MDTIIKIYDLYCKTINKCYYYKDNNDYIHLLNEIGVLRGLEEALRLFNIGVAHIEYKNFIDLQDILINKYKKK